MALSEVKIPINLLYMSVATIFYSFFEPYIDALVHLLSEQWSLINLIPKHVEQSPADTWLLVCVLWPAYLTDRMRVGYLIVSDEASACERSDDPIRD